MTLMTKQTQYIAVVIAIIFVALFIGSVFVEAHGEGESFEAKSGDYLVDIGYSVEEFTDDTSVVFDFNLEDADGHDAPFTDIWVRIVHSDKKSTVFASGINNAKLGGAIMTYVFPEVEPYELSARYQDGGTKVAEASFPLTVRQGRDTRNGLPLLPAIVGVLAGVVLGLALGEYMRRRKAVT